MTDIRDRLRVGPEDIPGLNFMRAGPPYVFRRHYRQGLRSHILEVLNPDEVNAERAGILEDGVLRFPRARPVKMFRVFRSRFRDASEGLQEIRRVKLVEHYLSSRHVARSEEFLVDYRSGRSRGILLCGLQEYVEGEPLDPWSPARASLLPEVLARASNREPPAPDPVLEESLGAVQDRAASFIDRVKRMVRESALIPDLAGVNNLLLTASGFIKLVDINNVSSVSFGRRIVLDDKGYPICDKSVQALALLEQKLLGREPNPEERIYGVFLDPVRVREVKAAEEDFHRGVFAGRDTAATGTG
ncbi:MAG: hypothetical protein ACQET7_14650 [Thermodesulfobacteriota bacterium]